MALKQEIQDHLVIHLLKIEANLADQKIHSLMKLENPKNLLVIYQKNQLNGVVFHLIPKIKKLNSKD